MKKPIQLLIERRTELFNEYKRVESIEHWELRSSFENDKQHDLDKIKAIIDKYDTAIALLK